MERNPSLAELLRLTGFEICEFGPDPRDPCDKCKKADVQLYFGHVDFFEHDGDYYCLECVTAEHLRNCDYDDWITQKVKNGEVK